MDPVEDAKKAKLPFLNWRETRKYLTHSRIAEWTWSGIHPQIQKNQTKWIPETNRFIGNTWTRPEL